MKFLLKDCLRPALNILREPNLRTFYRLCSRYLSAPRYQKFNNVKFNELNVEICDGQSFVFQYKDIFLDEIYRFRAEKEPLIIDCGANIGMSVLFFKKLFPASKIIAFEPDPIIFDFLERNVNGNQMHDGVELINKAVWIDSNGVNFSSEGADGGSINLTNGTKLPSISLKELLKQFPEVDFLKMDIEGAENVVIPDCADSMKKIRNIFIEFHSSPGNKAELSSILEVLENCGFSYYLSPVHTLQRPFEAANTQNNAFFQLNIFGYRQQK